MPSMTRMLATGRRKGRPSSLSDDGKIRLVWDFGMGVLVNDLAVQHDVSTVSIWKWLRQGRALIRERGVSPWV